jgi:hypothetical protein
VLEPAMVKELGLTNPVEARVKEAVPENAMIANIIADTSVFRALFNFLSLLFSLS